MAADGTATHPATPARPQFPAACLPEQARRRAAASPADRIVRQVEAIDAWVAARRQREHVLAGPRLNRDERMYAAREVEALRRTHDAIKGRCARGMDAELEPMHWRVPTAVVAHRHAWFADKLTLLLADRGVTLLVCTDNGAEALGAVVAEQPDIVLAGDRLAMIPGRRLLAESRRYAPGTLLAGQASDPSEADALRSVADSVFLRQQPPGAVADALVALHLTTAAGVSGA